MCPDKLEKLDRLYRRGNLTEEEYSDARLRIERGKVRERKSSPSVSISHVFSTLGADLSYMLSDPEVIRRKKALADKASAGSFGSGSGRSSAGDAGEAHHLAPSPGHVQASRASSTSSPPPAENCDDASQQHLGAPAPDGFLLERPRGRARMTTAPRRGRTSSSSFDILGEIVTGSSPASTGPEESPVSQPELPGSDTPHDVPSFYRTSTPVDGPQAALLMDGAEYDGTRWRKGGVESESGHHRPQRPPPGRAHGILDEDCLVDELYPADEKQQPLAIIGQSDPSPHSQQAALRRQAELAARQPSKQGAGFMGLFGL